MANNNTKVIHSKILGYSLPRYRYNKWKKKAIKSIYIRIIIGLLFGAFIGLLTDSMTGILLSSILAFLIATIPQLIMFTPIPYYFRLTLSIIMLGIGISLFYIVINSFTGKFDINYYLIFCIGILLAWLFYLWPKDTILRHPNEYDDDFVLQKLRD